MLPPPPPGPPPAEPDFGGQSFQDLDISTPAVAASAGAPRFESKAVEPGPGSQASAASASSPNLLVTVNNPCMEGQGISSHFTYEVTTKTSLPQYKFGQFSVTRRFRDFDWLHAQLAQKFAGVIVPPLPEKQSATVQTMRVSGVGFSAEWLEERRSQLEGLNGVKSNLAKLQLLMDLPPRLQACVDAKQYEEAVRHHRRAQRLLKV